jgi:hypothetical protein
MLAVAVKDIHFALRECLMQAYKSVLQKKDNEEFRAALSGTMTAICFMVRLLADIEKRPAEDILKELGFSPTLTPLDKLAERINETFAGKTFEAVQSNDESLIDICKTIEGAVTSVITDPPDEADLSDDATQGIRTGTMMVAALVAQSLSSTTGAPRSLIMDRMAIPQDVRQGLSKSIEHMHTLMRAMGTNKGDFWTDLGDTKQVH